jgi:hypothetical protein
LVVSHVIDPDSAAYQRWRTGMKTFFEGWLPLVARLVAVVLTVLILWHEVQSYPNWGPYLAQLGFVNAWSLPLLVALFVMAALCVLWGVAIRIAALALLYLACLDSWAHGFVWYENGLLFTAAAIVTHLGSWWFTRWQPEEPILRIHFGKREERNA